MNLKAFFLLYKQAWLVYLLVHGWAAYLTISGEFLQVISLLFFLKVIQYVSIYFFYTKLNTTSLVFFMNLGIRIRNLLIFTYVFDMLLLVITLMFIKL